MNEELDIDDVQTPEHAPAPAPEAGIVVSVGNFAPAAPLVDSKWVAALKSVIKQVKELVIKDQPSLQLAVNYQARLTEARKQLEAARKNVKAPFLAACKAIDAAADLPDSEARAAVERLRDLQINFAESERKRVAKEEADRQAEIARLKAIADAERAKAEKEAAARAEEARINEENDRLERERKVKEAAAAGKPAPIELDFDEVAPPAPEPLPEPPPPVKSEAQVALEAALHAPAPKAAVAVGVQMRTTLEIGTLDVAKLPDCFVTKTANLQAIRAAFCVKWTPEMPIPQVEGVTFIKKELPVTRSPRV